MTSTAFLDACVLHNALLNNILLTIAENGGFRPYWSDLVLDELERSLRIDARLSKSQVERRVGNMRRAFANSTVADFEHLIDEMTCNLKDRHVLAAAVHGGCQLLVTFNLRDFPKISVEPLGLAVVHPDAFLVMLLDNAPLAVVQAIGVIIAEFSRPVVSLADLIDQLRSAGVPDFASRLSHSQV